MADRKPLFILGNMPPPVGGVSTFMRRYVALLRSRGEEPHVRDWTAMSLPARVRWFLQLVLDPRPLHLELNAYETWAMLALVLRPFPCHILLRIHSGRPETNLPASRKRLYAGFLHRVDEFVLVGPHVRDVMATAGFRIPEDARIEPAFLPPPPEDEPGIMATYRHSELAFVEDRHPLIVMQGSDAFYQGLDLYGTDLALEVLPHILDRHPDAGLLIGRPTPGDAEFQAYCRELDRRIERGGLAERVLILEGEREFWPLLKRADVFLRPTALDGDSISVREALHFGVPVLASDAVPRPEGTVLFANRDAADLTRALLGVLEARLESAPLPGDTSCS